MIEVFAAGPLDETRPPLTAEQLRSLIGQQHLSIVGALAAAERLCGGPAWVKYADNHETWYLARTGYATEVIEDARPLPVLPLPDVPPPPECDYTPVDEDFIYRWGNNRPLNWGGWYRELYSSPDGRWFLKRFEAWTDRPKTEEVTAEDAWYFMLANDQQHLLRRYFP